MLPFKEKWISTNESIRTFYHDIDDDELKWHIDYEDRLIKPLNENDWKFQFDNELPINIDGEIFIKKGIWHRIIKGKGELNLIISRI